MTNVFFEGRRSPYGLGVTVRRRYAAIQCVVLRFQNDPHVKILVLLGEVGGTLEYDVCKAIRDGVLTKPIVAWCTGTVAANFTYDVQFGHAGALANSDLETASAKNKVIRGKTRSTKS